MRVRVIWIGKTKDQRLAGLSSDFTTRIRRFLPLDITELKDSKVDDDARRLEDEAQKILAAIDDSDRVIVLDVEGQSWSSRQFATFLDKHMGQGARRLTFVIGGYSGLAKSVKQRADQTWSLSPLTFTHDMTRVLLLEQIYRAMAILNNHPYSK